MGNVYRKAALDRLSSPEQLDKMIIITPPRLWVALCGAVIVIASLLVWSILGHITEFQDVSGIYINVEGVQNTYCNSTGIVEEILIGKGETVREGDPLYCIKESETNLISQLKANCSGVVYDVGCQKGQIVTTGEKIAEIKKGTEEASQMKIVCYVPITVGKKMQEGMPVIIMPMTVNTQEYGHMTGKIETVGTYAVDETEMLNTIGNTNLVQAFESQGACVEMVIALDEDSNTQSGYMWSNKKGKDVVITDQTPVAAKVVVDKKAPIELLVPAIKSRLN